MKIIEPRRRHKPRVASVLGGETIPEALIETKVKCPYTLDLVAFTTMVPRKLLMKLEARGKVLEEKPLKEPITYDLAFDNLTKESKGCVHLNME
jgi:hypothetical protein